MVGIYLMKNSDIRKRNNKVIKRFEFDISVDGFKSVNVLGDKVYCFNLNNVNSQKIKKFIHILKKLKYSIIGYPIGNGVSINTNSKRVWFYNSQYSLSAIIDSPYKGIDKFEDMRYSLNKYMKIEKEQSELIDTGHIDVNVNVIPEYISDYKLTFWQRMVS